MANKRNNYNKNYKKKDFNGIPEKVSFDKNTINKPEETEVVEEEQLLNGKVVGCNKLRVRKNPILDADIEDEIALGAMVLISLNDSTDDFYSVIIPDKNYLSGYCMRKFIKIS